MKTRLRRFFILCAVCPLLFAVLGCDAFVRKFTRKSKKKDVSQQELVLVPEEYKPPKMTKEEVYRQYFLYWKSWHDELINALLAGASQKKRVDCADEALKNLEELRKTLQGPGQKKLDVYLNQLKDLKSALEQDLYGSNTSQNRLTAERIRRGIMRYLSYDKIKAYLA